MPSENEHKDVIRRITELEKRATNIEKSIIQIQQEINNQDKEDLKLDMKLRQLQDEFKELKEEIVFTVHDQTEKTWELIHKGSEMINKELKILFSLILLLLTIAFGVKVAPEFLKIVGLM